MGNCQYMPPGVPLSGTKDISSMFAPVLDGTCMNSQQISTTLNYKTPGWYEVTWTPNPDYITDITITETTGKHPCSLILADGGGTNPVHGYFYFDGDTYYFGYTATFTKKGGITCTDTIPQFCVPCVSSANGLITVTRTLSSSSKGKRRHKHCHCKKK